MHILCITSTRASITNVRPEGEWFIGLHRAGARVTLMTEADTDYAKRFRGAGIPVIDFHTRGKFDSKAIAQIRGELDGIDVVFAMNNKSIANAAFAVRGSSARLVSYRGQTGNISRWNPGCYLTHLSPQIDGIICVADAVRQSVAAQLRDPTKAVTVYKGHNLAWYDVEPVTAAELGIRDDCPRVVCVSNYRPRKGIEILLKSFGQMKSKAHLILVGSGMDDAGLTRLAHRYIDPSRYHPLGFRDDSLAITAAAHIAVLPALRREGLPKTVIEAMACGIVPVVTNTGGNAELVIDGESGLVVPPGSESALAGALQRLCDDAELRLRMGEKARDRIGSHFRTEDTVKKTLAFFRQLLNKV